MEDESKNKYLPSFGRKKARKLSTEKTNLFATLLPKISFSGLEKKYKRNILEIGFGSGEHLVKKAEENSDNLFIGAEVYEQGVGNCLKKIAEKKIKNIRIFQDDARILFSQIPKKSLDEIYLLFPDPWPKTKHFKRRIINQDFLEKTYSILKKGGKLFIASDHMEYIEWIMIHIYQSDKFIWDDYDYFSPHKNYAKTRYDEKCKTGSQPVFLRFSTI